MFILKIDSETITGIEDLRSLILEYHYNAADIVAVLDDINAWDYLLEKLKKSLRTQNLSIDDVIDYIDVNLFDDLETDGLL